MEGGELGSGVVRRELEEVGGGGNCGEGGALGEVEVLVWWGGGGEVGSGLVFGDGDGAGPSDG